MSPVRVTTRPLRSLTSRQLVSASDAGQHLLVDTRERDWRVATRVGMLLAVAALELLALRAWLNAVDLQHGGSLIALIAERGPDTFRFLVVRFAIVFGLVAIVFGDLGSAIEPGRLLAAAVQRPIDRRILLTHFAVVAFFAVLCAVLIRTEMPTAIAASLTLVWILTALAAMALVLVAFLPRAFWRQL